MTPANFDRVARLYRPLEFVAFGRALEHARSVHLRHLAGCHDILLLGDGDGRALEQMLAHAPTSHIVSVDASRVMLDLARQRVATNPYHDRVTFQHGDARALSFRDETYDAVVTQWFLDCFTPAETAALVRTLAPVIRPGGIWLFADFAIPERGRLARLAARVVTSGLYGFFRRTTGISARALPASEREIRRNGFTPMAEASLLGGLLRSVVFRKAS